MEQSKQDKRKEQILSAALHVIVEKGYDGSRMDDIVVASKLSKGAIYWYFKSKKEVYLSLVNYWVHNYSAVLNHIVEDGDPAARQLTDLFQYFVDQYESNSTVFKALVEFWSLASRDTDFREKFQTVYSEFTDLIEKIVIHGVNDGEFKNLNTRIAALSIMVNIEATNWFTLFDTHGVTVREYMDTISDFILAGLIKKSHEG
ncbi:TetR/AcrR family transcriptional regulator [Candidatus Neomarinimicrobiota bacterium]